LFFRASQSEEAGHEERLLSNSFSRLEFFQILV